MPLLNMADLAFDADVAPNTAKSWLSVLQGSGKVFLLRPLEIGKTATPTICDVRSLGAFDKLGQAIGPGGIICLCQTNCL